MLPPAPGVTEHLLGQTLRSAQVGNLAVPTFQSLGETPVGSELNAVEEQIVGSQCRGAQFLSRRTHRASGLSSISNKILIILIDLFSMTEDLLGAF